MFTKTLLYTPAKDVGETLHGELSAFSGQPSALYLRPPSLVHAPFPVAFTSVASSLRRCYHPAMTRDEAIKLLKGGPGGVAEWNRQREATRTRHPPPDYELAPHLALWPVNIRETEYEPVNLDRIDLRGVALHGANLANASLWGADFTHAGLANVTLVKSSLVGAVLAGADLRNANLQFADLRQAVLRDADLSSSQLADVVLHETQLAGAKLVDVCLIRTTFCSPWLGRVDFGSARFGWTRMSGRANLSQAKGLESARFDGPCTIGTDVLAASKGRIPASFLLGCGFQPWEVLAAKLHDPTLSAEQINEVQYKIFDLRTRGRLLIGGVFISYSHEDSAFVDKVYKYLTKKEISVWLDKHKIVAGPLQKQVDRAIRINDIVLLVLSEASMESDWVEHELEIARKKEKDEKRDILCPVTLDDAWKGKMNDVLWRQVKKKNVLDFSKWKTKAFGPQFQKLLKGLKIYYEREKDKDEAGKRDEGT